MDKDKIEHHIKHLKHKHEDLEKRIQANPTDYIVSQVLKKEKLQLKDEIEKLKLKLQ
jgi:hypothetical protein